jgi:hypothetical protein
MKLIFCILALNLMLAGCDPAAPYIDGGVKLLATVNDTAETIAFGDTLKFTLTIPDTLVTDSGTVVVNSLQQAYYNYDFEQVDTTLPVSDTITNVTRIFSNAFATNGSCNGVQLYIATNKKPYTATLNIVPPSRGIFYVQISDQAGIIKANGSTYIGLAVNFNVANQHWYLLETYDPGFTASELPFYNAGFGWYCFRVK